MTIDKKIPKIKWNNGITYSFTINPSDEIQFFGKERRSLRVHEIICLKMDTLKPYIEYTLYPEYSEPECKTAQYKGPRMHYHGTLKFIDIFGFLELGFYKLSRWSVFEIDTISDQDYWHKYCTKQQHIWKRRKFDYKITQSTSRLLIKPKAKKKNPLDLLFN